MPLRIFGLLMLLALTSCVSNSPAERQSKADLLVAGKGWQKLQLPTVDFVLTAYVPSNITSSDTLTIYIEGDGLAWINASTPSFNPTPNNPLALKLALRDTSPAAYLARPCQYIELSQSSNCSQKYWTHSRFSPEVIDATNQAIDQIKLRFNADKLILVGYSGGGAVAALAAARRQDVIRLVTIAGNLDHRIWVKEHHLSPLSNSLNPADEWEKLQNIPQTHFVGGKDLNVGESVARGYAAKFPSALRPSIIVIPNFDHHCCWEENWPNLKDRNQ